MSVVNKIAYFMDRKDEALNQALARELTENSNAEGVQEIAENLFNSNEAISNDCIKVLYEAGYSKPEMIAAYVNDFIKLLKSKNNRMVWGAMLALSTVVIIAADEIYRSIDAIYQAMEEGSVITIDNGVKVLAGVAAHDEAYNKSIFPYLINHLKTCRPKEIGQHAESTFIAVNQTNREEYISALLGREGSLTSAQKERCKKLICRLSKELIL